MRRLCTLILWICLGIFISSPPVLCLPPPDAYATSYPLFYLAECAPPPSNSSTIAMAGALAHGVRIGLVALESVIYRQLGLNGHTSDIPQQPRIQLVAVDCSSNASVVADIVRQNQITPFLAIFGGYSETSCIGMSEAASQLSIPYLTTCVSSQLEANATQSSDDDPIPLIPLGSDVQAEVDDLHQPTATIFRMQSSNYDQLTAMIDFYLRVQWLMDWQVISQAPTCLSFIYAEESEINDDALSVFTNMLIELGVPFTYTAPFRSNPVGDFASFYRLQWMDFYSNATSLCQSNAQLHVIFTFLDSATGDTFFNSLFVSQSADPSNPASNLPVLELFNRGDGIFQFLFNEGIMGHLTSNSTYSFPASQFDGVLGMARIPSTFSRARDYYSHADLYTVRNLTANARLGPFFPDNFVTKSAFDAIITIEQALKQLLQDWQWTKPKWKQHIALRQAIQNVHFIGATGGVKFRLDASHLGDRKSVKFGIMQYRWNGTSQTDNSNSNSVMVASWTPDVGASTEILEQTMISTNCSQIILEQFLSPSADKSQYQPLLLKRHLSLNEARFHGEPPLHRYAACAVASNEFNSIYIVGGRESDDLGNSQVNQFDLLDQVWHYRYALGEVPMGRYGAACNMINTELFLYGGMNPEQGTLSDLWKFSVIFQTWVNVVPMGTMRSQAYPGIIADPSWQGRIFMWGGVHDSNTFSTLFMVEQHGFEATEGRISTQILDPSQPPTLFDFASTFSADITGKEQVYVRGRVPTYLPPLVPTNCSRSPPQTPCANLTAAQLSAYTSEAGVLTAFDSGLNGYGAVIQRANASLAPFLLLMTDQKVPLLFDLQENTIRAVPSICNVAAFLPLTNVEFPSRGDQIGDRLYVSVSVQPANATQPHTEIWSLSTDCDFDQSSAATCPTSPTSSTGCGVWRKDDQFGKGEGHVASVVYDSNIIYFGGIVGSSPKNSIYSFDATATSTGATSTVSINLNDSVPTSSSMTTRIHGSRVVPKPRYGHSSARVGEQILVFGGRVESQPAVQSIPGVSLSTTNEFFAYNLTSDDWTQISPTVSTPTARRFHTAFAMRSRLIIAGGVTATDDALMDMQYYDSSTNRWYPVPTSVFDATPPPRSALLSFVVNDTDGFIFGGQSGAGEMLNDMYSYQFESPTCDDLKTMNATCRKANFENVTHDVSALPSALGRVPKVAYGVGVFVDIVSKFYVFAGDIRSDTVQFQSSFVCDLSHPSAQSADPRNFLCTWRALKPFPVDDTAVKFASLKGASGILIYPFIYLFGGMMSGMRMNSRVLRFHVPTELWDNDASASFTQQLRSNSWINQQLTMFSSFATHRNRGFLYGGSSVVHDTNINQLHRMLKQITIFTAYAACTTFSDAEVSRNCSVCAGGSYSSDRYCYTCQEGEYRGYLDPLDSCLQCPPGTMSTAIAATSRATCTPCAAGSYAPNVSSGSCIDCASNEFCPLMTALPLPMPSFSSYINLTQESTQLTTDLAQSNAKNVSHLQTILTSVTLGIIGLFIFLYVAAWSVNRPVRFKKMDWIYRDYHASVLQKRYYKAQGIAIQGSVEQEMGGQIYERPTSMGGLFTLICIVVMISLIAQLSLTYFLNNVSEQFVLVPNTAIGASIGAVTSHMTFSTKLYYWNPNITGQESPCIDPVTRTCNDPHVYIYGDLDGMSAIDWAAADAKQCAESIVPSSNGQLMSCEVSFTCKSCSLSSSNGHVEFRLSAADSYAFGVEVRLSTSAAYPGQISTMHRSVAVIDGSTALVGMSEATHFPVLVTQVVYMDQDASSNSPTTGWQVSSPGVIQMGPQADRYNFTLDRGVKVRFDLEVAASTLQIVHKPVQTTIQFTAALFGLAGVIGGLGVVLRFAESIENNVLRFLALRHKNLSNLYDKSAERLLFFLRNNLAGETELLMSRLIQDSQTAAARNGSASTNNNGSNANATNNRHGGSVYAPSSNPRARYSVSQAAAAKIPTTAGMARSSVSDADLQPNGNRLSHSSQTNSSINNRRSDASPSGASAMSDGVRHPSFAIGGNVSNESITEEVLEEESAAIEPPTNLPAPLLQQHIASDSDQLQGVELTEL